MPENIIEVVNNESAGRYEARLDGAVAGFAEYRTQPGRVIFTHTEVATEAEGQGVGSTLAQLALEDVRRLGNQVVPQCPFIAAYIRKHADAYLDLVDERYRGGVASG